MLLCPGQNRRINTHRSSQVPATRPHKPPTLQGGEAEPNAAQLAFGRPGLDGRAQNQPPVLVVLPVFLAATLGNTAHSSPHHSSQPQRLARGGGVAQGHGVIEESTRPSCDVRMYGGGCWWVGGRVSKCVRDSSSTLYGEPWASFFQGSRYSPAAMKKKEVSCRPSVPNWGHEPQDDVCLPPASLPSLALRALTHSRTLTHTPSIPTADLCAARLVTRDRLSGLWRRFVSCSPLLVSKNSTVDKGRKPCAAQSSISTESPSPSAAAETVAG